MRMFSKEKIQSVCLTLCALGSFTEKRWAVRHIHDLSTIGYSLGNGICRYDITTIRLQNGERSVSIIPEQLCRGREIGCVVIRVETADIQVFQLSLAPEKGWFIRTEYQSAQDNVMMTEELFFRAIDKLA